MRPLICFIVLLFCACVTPRNIDKYFSKNPDQLQFKAEQFYDRNPEKFAQRSSEKFPVRVEFLPGKEIVVRDTVKGDFIPCPGGGKVKCPDAINTTTTIHDTIIKPDNAKIAAISLAAEKKYNELKKLYDDGRIENARLKTIQVICYRALIAITVIIILFFILKKWLR